MLLMTNFIVIPIVLRDVIGLESAHHWHIYLPVLIISALIMLPFLIFGERYNKVNYFILGAIVIMCLSQVGLYLADSTFQIIFILLAIFFVAFNYLEATLPSIITKNVSHTQKGTALGVYSTCQFSGTFFGGFLGGYCYEHFDISGVFLLGTVVTILWLLISLNAPRL